MDRRSLSSRVAIEFDSIFWVYLIRNLDFCILNKELAFLLAPNQDAIENVNKLVISC
jgi:hypothetical protein